MSKKRRSHRAEAPVVPNNGETPAVYDAPASDRETVPVPPPPFTLPSGSRLIRGDGSYLAVVATAAINGTPHIIVQEHTATGDRAPHPKSDKTNGGHAPMPLDEAERRVAAGEFTIGHAPS